MAGPTIQDIRRRAIPRTLRLSSSGQEIQETDPIEKAKEIREQLVGSALVDAAVEEARLQTDLRRADIEARQAKSELEKAEAKQKLAALNAPDPGQNGHTSTTEMAMAIVELMREQTASIKEGNDTLRGELQQMRETQLAEAIASLKGEIGDLRKSQVEVASGIRQPDSAETVLSRVEELSAVYQALKGFAGTSPEIAGINSDIQQIIALKRLDAETTFRLEQLKDDREKRDWDRRLDLRKLELEERRFTGFQQAFDQLAPVLGMFARQRAGLPAETPVGLPSSGPTTIESQPCQRENCKGIVTVATGQNIAACPDCGTVYQLGQQQ